MKLPVLFLGHGSPMNAIEDTVYSRAWTQLGEDLRTRYGSGIKAILAISAHWYTDGSAVTAMEKPRTIHDFGGFPKALFDMQYPADGSPELTARVRGLLGEDKVAADTGWGLDHGTWGVLCHVFPQADIPVVQLSLNVRLDLAEHYAIGEKLAALREEGVLIVASGNVVHNLRTMDRYSMDTAGAGYDWAEHVRVLVNQWVEQNDTAALIDENAYPADINLAAPTPDHYWPLLYAVGAAQGDNVRIFNDDIVGKSLSMTSMVWGM
ncbi:4,5-DOPA dioxygenase extradiol [Neisseria perflava]|uniref:4,5-DOPA-extradiol-dioxygenase n=1 Tax=Neisseria perflava TaxID=33053 RepID=UPI00209D68A0|nr:4,5-DOPA dioxygenase extradiol [Neisseria perflava]MCP1659965.1 4,5-DOPA dioxygenase extradiol [Neisseria perflava]MCP1773199.1 4,5-DOPA dioxygenase extradiol [Neisseria perflava]